LRDKRLRRYFLTGAVGSWQDSLLTDAGKHAGPDEDQSRPEAIRALPLLLWARTRRSGLRYWPPQPGKRPPAEAEANGERISRSVQFTGPLGRRSCSGLLLRARTWRSGLRYVATAPGKKPPPEAQANGERISRSVQFAGPWGPGLCSGAFALGLSLCARTGRFGPRY
jgi:hypothetical protein